VAWIGDPHAGQGDAIVHPALASGAELELSTVMGGDTPTSGGRRVANKRAVKKSGDFAGLGQLFQR
jgi:hypothetical protein